MVSKYKETEIGSIPEEWDVTSLSDAFQNLEAGVSVNSDERQNADFFVLKTSAISDGLIVVDKLLTGFDAPPCTYLYIDKRMQDHGLFQAICRVNRLDDDSKDFGYIVDYTQLFGQLQTAMKDYTSGAFEGYDPEDVKGLVKDRHDATVSYFDQFVSKNTFGIGNE